MNGTPQRSIGWNPETPMAASVDSQYPSPPIKHRFADLEDYLSQMRFRVRSVLRLGGRGRNIKNSTAKRGQHSSLCSSVNSHATSPPASARNYLLPSHRSREATNPTDDQLRVFLCR